MACYVLGSLVIRREVALACQKSAGYHLEFRIIIALFSSIGGGLYLLHN
jgi:hypothetical protein